MGIYIKGRKYMPENCAMCPLCHRNFDGNETRLACYALKKWCDENIDRLSDCPLVEVPEPHGRLIDADALMNIFADRLVKVSERYGINSAVAGAVSGAMKLLDLQPTVIEAEGE